MLNDYRYIEHVFSEHTISLSSVATTNRSDTNVKSSHAAAAGMTSSHAAAAGVTSSHAAAAGVTAVTAAHSVASDDCIMKTIYGCSYCDMICDDRDKLCNHMLDHPGVSK